MQRLLAELTSGDDLRAEGSIPGLSALGEAVLPALRDLTRSADPDQRWWAVRALAASPAGLASDLVPLLDDPRAEVRAAAALAVCSHPHADAVPALVRTLSDPDPMTAGLAGNALVMVGNAAVPALLDAAPGASPAVRIHILRALAAIRDHRAIPLLMKTLSEDSAVLQYWATEGLERLGLDMVYIKP